MRDPWVGSEKEETRVEAAGLGKLWTGTLRGLDKPGLLSTKVALNLD